MSNEIDTLDDKETRVYEFSYLLVPGMAEEDVTAKVDSLKKLFTDNGATIIADEVPEYIGLAYTMIHKVNNKNERVNSAYFGWFKFTSEPDILEKVKVAIDRDVELVRYLLVKTVAENTMMPKKLGQKRDMRKRTTDGDVASDIEVADIPESTPALADDDVTGDEIAVEDLVEIDGDSVNEVAETETKE
ncbi:MAG: small subunit ribosomal protein [Bacteroidota bacterium]|jgi:ribosomal protein S6|nr:small subunit ribosomal protein [Bacteroidota bacterium]